MNREMNSESVREALANLPQGTSHGEQPSVHDVYLPRSHLRALDPDNLVVTAMRGAGKTFWWSALQSEEVRQFVGEVGGPSELRADTEVRTGFGVNPSPDHYPSKDVLQKLENDGIDARIVWRSVQSWHLAPDGHPLHQQGSWPDRAAYVKDNPEIIDRLFYERDAEFERKGVYFLILFDALDRCSDDWKTMHRAIRGLLQTALEMRSYRRLRVKVFLRSDQLVETEVADFPDASKVLSSAVRLNWPRRDLYGLLWHRLANGPGGDLLRNFLGRNNWDSVQVGAQSVFQMKRHMLSEPQQRELFHTVAGPWMGRGPKRGFPYTWIPSHLSDTEGMVSPRSFLAALREAATQTTNEHSDHQYALHYDSIKRGVQEASRIRVQELQEDYPWVDRVLTPLRGMVVPCEFKEITAHWDEDGTLDSLVEDVLQNDVKLPPLNIESGASGLLQDLESLGVFQRIRDGRVNIPDVFRVGYGLGRRGVVSGRLAGLSSRTCGMTCTRTLKENSWWSASFRSQLDPMSVGVSRLCWLCFR